MDFDKTKPYRGALKDWWVHYPLPEFKPPEGSLGYIICGTFVGHEDFDGEEGHTSWVVAHNEDTGEVETMNSRYILVGDPKKEPVHAGR